MVFGLEIENYWEIWKSEDSFGMANIWSRILYAEGVFEISWNEKKIIFMNLFTKTIFFLESFPYISIEKWDIRTNK